MTPTEREAATARLAARYSAEILNHGVDPTELARIAIEQAVVPVYNKTVFQQFPFPWSAVCAEEK